MKVNSPIAMNFGVSLRWDCGGLIDDVSFTALLRFIMMPETGVDDEPDFGAAISFCGQTVIYSNNATERQ